MKVAVIGGGISGLTTAFKLSQAGAAVTVYERSSRLGGLASSFDMGAYQLERYYHFVCGGDEGLYQLLRELEIFDKLKWQQSTTGFFYEGKLYPFRGGLDLLRFSPISLFSRLRFGLIVLYARFLRDWQSLDEIPAKQWLINFLGQSTYQVIWEPLLKIKFGRYHEQVSAAWLCHRIYRVSKSRPNLFEPEKMGYVEGGCQTIIDALERKISLQGGEIRLNSPVQSILVENDQVSGVVVDDTQHQYDKVVAAVPLSRLNRLLPKTNLPKVANLKAALEQIHYIGVVCLVLRLKKSLTDYFWVNINDSSMSINGIIEYTNLNPCPELGGDKIVYVPFYLPTDEPRYTFKPQQLLAEYLAALKQINPDFRSDWVIDYRVFRNPQAQAICTTDFLKKIPDYNPPVPNLLFLDSIHIYPEDRTLSGMADLAYNIASLIT